MYMDIHIINFIYDNILDIPYIMYGMLNMISCDV